VTGVGRSRKPQAVLFACGWNAVRSPMAAALFRHLVGRGTYVESVGVRQGDPDPFAVAALDEIGIDIGKHRPRTFEELEEFEGLNFDLIVTLAPEAHHKALDLTRTLAADVEYWPIPDATAAIGGNREQTMEAYRGVRDMLMRRIKDRFAAPVRGNE
jgi:protein-tyrosine-phosphatase